MVMAAAVAVFGVLYRLALRQGTPLFALGSAFRKESLETPRWLARSSSALAGAGRVLSGSAIVVLPSRCAIGFVAAMIAGMLVYRIGLPGPTTERIDLIVSVQATLARPRDLATCASLRQVSYTVRRPESTSLPVNHVSQDYARRRRSLRSIRATPSDGTGSLGIHPRVFSAMGKPTIGYLDPVVVEMMED